MKKLFLFLMVINLNFGFCNEYNHLFIKYGNLNNIPPILLWAIAKHESGLNKNAVNKKNNDGSIDRGLMQVNSCHLPELKALGYDENDQIHHEVNVKYPSTILKNCIDLVGFNYKALNCYNGKIENNHYNVAVLNEIRNLKKDNKWIIKNIK